MSRTWRGSDQELAAARDARTVTAYRRRCTDVTDAEIDVLVGIVRDGYRTRADSLALLLAAYRAGVNHGRNLQALDERNRADARAENPE